MTTSVIIPAHNEQRYIARTIDSFNGADEIIVVANGCTDNTARIANSLGAKVIEEEEADLARAKNIGARYAKGDLLVFNDADTIVSPSYIDAIQITVRGGQDYGAAWVRSDSWRSSALAYAAMLNFGALFGVTCGNVFVKKEHFEAIDGFDEGLAVGSDNDLGDRLKGIGAKYALLAGASITPSSRDVNWKRIRRDLLSYRRFVKERK